MSAIGKLKPKVNVVGIVPATENMPGGKATKPGDIVKAMNGKTIEVINTDAEGRLILADALCYANKLGATQDRRHRDPHRRRRDRARSRRRGGGFQRRRVRRRISWRSRNRRGERYWQLPYYDEYTHRR